MSDGRDEMQRLANEALEAALTNSDKGQITALRAEVDLVTKDRDGCEQRYQTKVRELIQSLIEAEALRAEVEKLRAALVKADIYLARNAVGLAQDTIQSALEKKPHE